MWNGRSHKMIITLIKDGTPLQKTYGRSSSPATIDASTLEPGYYTVSIYNAAQTGQIPGDSAVSSSGIYVLAAPQNVSVAYKSADQKITITWDSVANAPGYSIALVDTSGTNGVTPLTTDGNTTSMDIPLSSFTGGGETYHATVSTTGDDTHLRSPSSDSVNTITKIKKPGEVVQTIDKANSKIGIQWPRVDGAAGYSVSVFDTNNPSGGAIFSKEIPQPGTQETSVSCDVDVSSFLDSDGFALIGHVQARGSSDDIPSNTVAASSAITEIAAPGALTFTYDSTAQQSQITWTVSGNTVKSEINIVDTASDNRVVFSKKVEAGTTELTIANSDFSATPNSIYGLTIRALAGDDSFDSITTDGPIVAIPPLEIPALTLIYGDGKIHATWQRGDQREQNYDLMLLDSQGNQVGDLITGAIDSTSFTISDSNTNPVYTVKIRANTAEQIQSQWSDGTTIQVYNLTAVTDLISGYGSNAIVAHWNAPGEVDDYTVEIMGPNPITPESVAIYTGKTARTTIFIQNQSLESGSGYTLIVTPRRGSSYGPKANVVFSVIDPAGIVKNLAQALLPDGTAYLVNEPITDWGAEYTFIKSVQMQQVTDQYAVTSDNGLQTSWIPMTFSFTNYSSDNGLNSGDIVTVTAFDSDLKKVLVKSLTDTDSGISWSLSTNTSPRDNSELYRVYKTKSVNSDNTYIIEEGAIVEGDSFVILNIQGTARKEEKYGPEGMFWKWENSRPLQLLAPSSVSVQSTTTKITVDWTEVHFSQSYKLELIDNTDAGSPIVIQTKDFTPEGQNPLTQKLNASGLDFTSKKYAVRVKGLREGYDGEYNTVELLPIQGKPETPQVRYANDKINASVHAIPGATSYIWQLNRKDKQTAIETQTGTQPSCQFDMNDKKPGKYTVTLQTTNEQSESPESDASDTITIEEKPDYLWKKVPNVAQYKGASWDNLIKKVKKTTVKEAKELAEADDQITFFFYMRSSMFLEGKSGKNGWTQKGSFSPGDAVFFSGHPWYGSAPQADAYEKKYTLYVAPPPPMVSITKNVITASIPGAVADAKKYTWFLYNQYNQQVLSNSDTAIETTFDLSGQASGSFTVKVQASNNQLTSPISNASRAISYEASQSWKKIPNVAQYGGASWDNLVKRVSKTTVKQAKQIAEDDKNITFFFYMRQYMYLKGKGQFKPGDAVFFSGKP